MGTKAKKLKKNKLSKANAYENAIKNSWKLIQKVKQSRYFESLGFFSQEDRGL